MIDSRTDHWTHCLAGLAHTPGLPSMVGIVSVMLQLQGFEPSVIQHPSVAVFQRWKYKTKL